MQRCKICQSITRNIEDKKKNLIYYRCTICGFIALDKSFIVNEEREKQQYEQHNNSFENEGYVQMFELFIEKAIMEYLDEINTALDFGSGPGPVLSKLLEQKGLKVDEYDFYFSPQKVYEGKKYDLITSTEVFEHLAKPLDILMLLVEHLNDSGYLVLMTKFPPEEDKAFLDWWYRRDPTHIGFFTEKSFEFMAQKMNLKLLKSINKHIVVFQKC